MTEMNGSEPETSTAGYLAYAVTDRPDLPNDARTHPPAAGLAVRPGWQAACHHLLLGLAGRLHDIALARARDHLAVADRRAFARELTWAVLESAVPLPEDDEDLLAELLEADGQDSGVLDDLPALPVRPVPPPYTFAAHPDGKRAGHADRDLHDQGGAPAAVAVAAAAALPGARGMWRAWRSPVGEATATGRWVQLLETSPGADLPAAAAAVQSALEAAGETAPQVEVYATGDELPWYQIRAREEGELVWAADRTSFIVAPVFSEEAQQNDRPGFPPDHPQIEDPEEVVLIVAYLESGRLLLGCSERLDDVVDPMQDETVPAGIRTDGTWVWSDATTYYLERYGLCPAEGLLDHIRRSQGTAPTVDDTTLHRALIFLTAPGPLADSGGTTKNGPATAPESP
ncbi:hypothetical protein [Streptomyces lydicus]|uniref:hypothetical protein n=1 Tax=Streptomyces lydicus TaxID=47763 RepID=UPI0036EF7E61